MKEKVHIAPGLYLQEYNHRVRLENERHAQALEELKARLLHNQNKCPHERTHSWFATSYDSPSSGRECLDCGKELG